MKKTTDIADTAARVQARERTPEPTDNRRVICVASRYPIKYSETFIQAHVERLPAKVVELTLRRFNSALLPEFFAKNQVDAVLAEYGPAGVMIMSACNAAGLPLVVHFHGFDAYKRETLERKGARYGELFEKSAAIVVVSRDMRRQLLSLGAPDDKIHLNPYGIDHRFFAAKDPALSPPTFAAVGRFVDKKAPHLTVIAFSKVHARYPEARLVMIGDGPLLEACKQLARSIGLSECIDFPGAQPHEAVATAMGNARAFVQHSIRTTNGDSEGTPLAILEAGAAGLPVVATRHAGIKDAVVDGETGLLVDERDINDMAQQMGRLLEDPDMARRLGMAARQRIVSEYSIDRSIDNLSSIIHRTIPRGRGKTETHYRLDGLKES